MLRCVSFFTIVLLATTVSSLQAAEEGIQAAAKKIGRSINLGNALEAPNEGEWGVTLKPEYFAAIKKAGFDSVRLPVKWSNHAAKEAPYTIDKQFGERVDWAIEQAFKNNLTIIVNVHHYDEMNREPAAHAERLAGLWTQIAERYQKQPDSVYFELLNEPHGELTDERWNELFPKLLAIVRKSNPTRPVVIGPGGWNSLGHLDKLKLPEDDRNLIATFHYYSPFEFTHQGAHWQAGADKWVGRKWGTPEELASLEKDFAQAAEWSKKHNRPLFLGEFGAFSAAELAQRVAWTRAIVEAAEKNKLPWCYWEFCSGFGAYDPAKDQWHQELLGALIVK